jgi:hypothetical protein
VVLQQQKQTETSPFSLQEAPPSDPKMPREWAVCKGSRVKVMQDRKGAPSWVVSDSANTSDIPRASIPFSRGQQFHGSTRYAHEAVQCKYILTYSNVNLSLIPSPPTKIIIVIILGRLIQTMFSLYRIICKFHL